jgi:CHAT domain-containing protein
MALFGDMDYDSDKVVINRDEIGLLPFTHFEVDSIYHNLPNNILCTKYVGKNATESLLKSIHTSEIDILHIASHGFYWDRRVKYGVTDPISKYIGKRRGDFTIEDMNMARTALLFSPKEKDSKEDGILFANEVSEMNFINLDLVTLSACKSAMGDLSSEGLIGLQRGFKKAGANSLLVSLDDVNDKATYLLMREFYKHLFAGYTKIESLQRAQHYVKNYNNKMYNNPKYWCPFILIDGLD